jgi:hypothetical protein
MGYSLFLLPLPPTLVVPNFSATDIPFPHHLNQPAMKQKSPASIPASSGDQTQGSFLLR